MRICTKQASTQPTTNVGALLTVAAVFCCLFPALAAAQTFSKKELQEIYSKYLDGEGYRPEVIDLGLKLKREGRTYRIIFSESDPTYFVLLLALQVEDKSVQGRLKFLEAANFATATTKVAKAYLDDDGDLMVAVETVQPSPADAAKAIPRMFRMIDYSLQKIASKLQK